MPDCAFAADRRHRLVGAVRRLDVIYNQSVVICHGTFLHLKMLSVQFNRIHAVNRRLNERVLASARQKTLSISLPFQFGRLQLAVTVGIELFEPFGEARDIATFRVADEFFQRDCSVLVPVTALEELI